MDKKRDETETPGPSGLKSKKVQSEGASLPTPKARYCSMGPEDSCAWQEKYIKLNEEFKEYKKHMQSEFANWGLVEARLIVLKRKCEEQKMKVDTDTEEILNMASTLQKLNIATFQQGVEQGLKQREGEVSKIIQYYQSERFKCELDLMEANEKITDLEHDAEMTKMHNERRIKKMMQENRNVELKNQALIGQMDQLRKDSHNTIDCYRATKTKAVEDYNKLYEMYTAVKIEKFTGIQKLKIVLQEDADTKRKYNQLLLEKYEIEATNKMLKELHRTDLENLQDYYEKRDAEKQKSVELQIKEFMGVVSSLKKHNDWLDDVISQDKDKNALREQAFTQFIKYIKEHLQRFEGIAQEFDMNQNDAGAENAAQLTKEESERALVTKSFMSLKDNLCQCMTSISNVLRDISESIGLEYHDTFARNYEKYVLIKKNESLSGKPSPSETVKLFSDWKIEEIALNKLVEGVSRWRATLVAQKERILEREKKLQCLLKAEQRERMRTDKKSAAILRFYKTSILKLTQSIVKQSKFTEDHYVHPNKSFERPDMWAHGFHNTQQIDYPMCCKENILKFKVLLEQTESALDKIANDSLHVVPTASSD